MIQKLKYPNDSFYKEIERMSIPTLEALTEALANDLEVNYEKIEMCLSQRKYLLTNIFTCTENEMEHLYCVATLIKDQTAMLFDKGNRLYEQMYKLWQEGKNEDFTDFYIKLSLSICYNNANSVLHFEDDLSGSDYGKMAKVLDNFYYEKLFGNLIIGDSMDYDAKISQAKFETEKETDDNWGEPWFFEKFPRLKMLPITWEFHNLLFHTNYALQDIIRINDVWSEANVVWQHIARQN